MSILNFLMNRSKVDAAAKKTARARKREGEVAEQLFQEAFRGFQEVASSDPVIADALYHWGFALFHQAQTKSGEEAERIYRDAGLKFAFCMTMNPQHLGAAIDWGAALMEQARAGRGEAREQLYALAREKFLAANAIQSGSASYNMACIHAIRGEDEDCRAALEEAREHGSLPGMGAILNDADLAFVQQRPWFSEFLQSLQEQSSATVNQTSAATEPQEAVKEPAVVEVVQEKIETIVEQSAAASEPPETAQEEEVAESAAEKSASAEAELAAEAAREQPEKKPGFMDFFPEKPALAANELGEDKAEEQSSKASQ